MKTGTAYILVLLSNRLCFSTIAIAKIRNSASFYVILIFSYNCRIGGRSSKPIRISARMWTSETNSRKQFWQSRVWQFRIQIRRGIRSDKGFQHFIIRCSFSSMNAGEIVKNMKKEKRIKASKNRLHLRLFTILLNYVHSHSHYFQSRIMWIQYFQEKRRRVCLNFLNFQKFC